ncbi:hypothetical protein ABGB12_15660 [Actinocorallia sp. B10E7]|uniref:alpha/beta hydrolase family protein n=1 Tax=Actinocorallia sp. B10E7 TaxID=3153558 RepID=UPI00325F57E9
MGLRRILRFALPAVLSAAFLTGAPGPARADGPVSTYTSTVSGDPADVYYPTGISERLPVALMLQGAQVGRAHYSAYARAVAAHGFIVVVPDHRRLLFFDNDYYPEQKQAADTVAWMKDENYRDGSPLEDLVKTTRLVLLGHSFGGATGLSIVGETCTFPFCTGLTYEMPTQVKGASFFGANNKSPLTGTFATIDLQVPTQLVQGVQDGVALPADAETTYTKMIHDPKQIVRVSGTNHYGITDTQNPAGADPEVGPQSLGQGQSIEIAARWAAKFLLAAMGDEAAADYVWNTGDAADPDVTVTGDN